MAPDGGRHPTATTRFLADLEQALQRRDVAAARDLGGPPSADRLAAGLARNVARLDVVGLDLAPRAATAVPSRVEERYGRGARVGEVQVSWRYAGVDRRTLTSSAAIVLTPSPRGLALRDTRAVPGQQAPPWFLEPLHVRRAPRVLVAAPDAARAVELADQASDAVAAVGRRLTGWRGVLVVEAPAATPVFRAGSGLGPAGGRSIAAVTTTADGATLPGSPERVFVNPRVFGTLGPPGQEIVLRHEATHVAVAAAESAAPLWLTEGLADWVALADNRLPVPVLASQVGALVRQQGPPRRLPGRAAFAPGNPDLGAAYESAWLAVRLIARTHGAADLLRFWSLVDGGRSVGEAFDRALGTDRAAFTRAWRRELLRVAG